MWYSFIRVIEEGLREAGDKLCPLKVDNDELTGRSGGAKVREDEIYFPGAHADVEMVEAESHEVGGSKH